MIIKKEYTILVKRFDRKNMKFSGTLEKLTKDFSYTLECGKSYERESGNKKINMTPRTIGSLITNLNNASDNSSSNGCSNKCYELEN